MAVKSSRSVAPAPAFTLAEPTKPKYMIQAVAIMTGEDVFHVVRGMGVREPARLLCGLLNEAFRMGAVSARSKGPQFHLKAGTIYIGAAVFRHAHLLDQGHLVDMLDAAWGLGHERRHSPETVRSAPGPQEVPAP